MIKNLVSILTLTLGVFTFSCKPATVDHQEVKVSQAPTFDTKWATTFTDSMNVKFAEYVAAGDSATIASLYWPDALLLLDYSEPVTGNNILREWGSILRSGVKEMKLSTSDVVGSPTYIIETGAYEVKDANAALLDKGKFMAIWEQRDGVWKMYRDISSTSMPAPK